MQDKFVNILSTALLDDYMLSGVEESNIAIDAHAFIDIDAMLGCVDKIKELSAGSHTIIMTSSNAARVVNLALSEKKPLWKIYCMQGTTARKVSQCFGESLIAGTAADSTSLAEKIIAAGEQSVIYLCGEYRRDELPDILTKAGIEVTEIVVYTTMFTPLAIIKHYDAILFCSPSAVDSFFMKNEITEDIVLFAIGKTTAKAIENYCDNEVVISEIPDKAHLVQTAIEYFKM